MPATDLRSIADRLVELCKSDQTEIILSELNHPDIVSVEAMSMPGVPAEIRGIDAVRQKHAWWYGAFEVHGATCEGPFLHGDDRFAVIFGMDVTNRETKVREQMREVGIYTVTGGRIVREEFFYG
jgi:hypothetical protein